MRCFMKIYNDPELTVYATAFEVVASNEDWTPEEGSGLIPD